MEQANIDIVSQTGRGGVEGVNWMIVICYLGPAVPNKSLNFGGNKSQKCDCVQKNSGTYELDECLSKTQLVKTSFHILVQHSKLRKTIKQNHHQKSR